MLGSMSTPRQPTRREALATFGSVSLAGLLAACGGDSDRSAGAGAPPSSAKAASAAARSEAPSTTTRRRQRGDVCSRRLFTACAR